MASIGVARVVLSAPVSPNVSVAKAYLTLPAGASNLAAAATGASVSSGSAAVMGQPPTVAVSRASLSTTSATTAPIVRIASASLSVPYVPVPLVRVAKGWLVIPGAPRVPSAPFLTIADVPDTAATGTSRSSGSADATLKTLLSGTRRGVISAYQTTSGKLGAVTTIRGFVFPTLRQGRIDT